MKSFDRTIIPFQKLIDIEGRLRTIIMVVVEPTKLVKHVSLREMRKFIFKNVKEVEASNNPNIETEFTFAIVPVEMISNMLTKMLN
jgi:hypothetical protein